MSQKNVSYIKFFAVKLFLILFAALAGSLAAFFLSLTLTNSTDAAFSAALSCILPPAVFFAFIYSFEAKIRVPDDAALTAGYYLAFTLKETSVYAIFAIPVNLIAALAGDGAFGSGIGASILMPHTPVARLGVPEVINYIALVLIYALISFTAHYISSKKAQTKDTDTSDDGDGGTDDAD